MTTTQAGDTQVYRIGCFMCHGGCGMLVHVKNGKAVKVEGDPDCPNSRGYLCVRGRNALGYVYHPDRLKYPLVRVGKRGSGRWQRVSWDEASEMVAERLMAIRQQYGPEAVAISVPTRGTNTTTVGTVFLRLFGSPNSASGGRAQCHTPRRAASASTFGRFLYPDWWGGTRLVVMWGAQINVSNPNHNIAPRLVYALRHGAKLIVVDPRRTAMARQADAWQALRPGTDAALALSWLNVIMNEGLYDREFVERWTNAPYLVREDTNELLVEADIRSGGDKEGWMVWDQGSDSPRRADELGVRPALTGRYTVGAISCQPVWQKLQERVSQYSPERASEITWVPAEEIRRAARMFATTKPALIIMGLGIDQTTTTHQSTRAICILKALCNYIDIPGGMADTTPIPGWGHPGDKLSWESVSLETRQRILGGDKYRLLGREATAHNPTLKRAILEGKPYPVKALICWSANPLITWADTPGTYKALKKVDFLMACDLFMTPTAQLADVVLPGATFLEKARVVTSNPDRHILFNRRILEPLGESRDEFDIAGDIMRRCGLGERWPWNNIEEFYAEELRKFGLDWYEWKEKTYFEGEIQYRKYLTDHYRPGGGFATRTGKVEVFSTEWREMGYDPLPYYREPPETPYSRPDLAQEYPLILITGGRLPMYFSSEFRQIPALRKLHPDPRLQIHPETAQKLGIGEGEWVWVETPRGRCRQRAKLFTGVDPRVVHINHGWWFPEKPQGEPGLSGAFESNSNMLTSCEEEFLDPGFGGYNLRGLLCKVYKAQTA